jgi:hypothetical protein
MTRTSRGAIVLLATAAFLGCGAAAAQPRGSPAGNDTPAKEAPESRQERPRRGYVPRLTRSESLQLQRERALEEVFDDATRATKLAELQTWIRRIPGRFQVEGRVERLGPGGPVGGKVSGVADCAGVGEGAGVQCIFNATWPVIDGGSLSFGPNAPIPRPTPSEALRTFRPALLALGLDPALSEVRALMVTDDSFAHTWAGRLSADTLRAQRLTGCRDPPIIDAPDFRCFQPLELTAEPESSSVTMVLRSSGITITLAMRRDPEARPEKPMKVR